MGPSPDSFKVNAIPSNASQPPAARAEESLPPDVKSFVEQRDACDHFRGEPYEGPSEGELVEQKERREFVIANLGKILHWNR